MATEKIVDIPALLEDERFKDAMRTLSQRGEMIRDYDHLVELAERYTDGKYIKVNILQSVPNVPAPVETQKVFADAIPDKYDGTPPACPDCGHTCWTVQFASRIEHEIGVENGERYHTQSSLEEDCEEMVCAHCGHDACMSDNADLYHEVIDAIDFS